MSVDIEPCEWLVGPPTGARTRVCFDAPSGAHALTPECIRQRYLAGVHNSALVVWHLPGCGLGGVRAGIDEVTWVDTEVAYFETAFCRPAKGSGYVILAVCLHDGTALSILASDRYDRDMHDWHFAVAALLEGLYPGCVRRRDDGYDA